MGDNVTLNVTGASAAFASKAVGTGVTVNITGLTIGGASVGNYTLPSPQSTTANITPLALTVSATGVNKVYDGTTHATANLTGNSLPGDAVTFGYTAAFADKNVAIGKAVSVSGIAISGADAGNYALQNTTASTTANITPAPLTVSATGINRVYDTTTTATVTLSDNHLGSDQVTDSYAGASFADKNVGTGKAVSVSGIAISGADAGNYALQNTTASTTANITPAPLTVSATGINRVYDTTTTATVTLSDNHLGTDQVTDSDTAASFADKNVGTGKAVSVSGIAISGADAGNYALQNTTASTTANITPAPLTVTATGVNRVYDTTTTATVTLSDNHLGTDQVTDSDTAASFADKNVGTGKVVSVSGIAISGADAGNYALQNTTASTTANITPAPLTVTATGVNRVYDTTTTATVTLSDNHLGTDQVTDSDTAASFADKNVGTGKAVSVSGIAISGADAGNYTLASTTASATANITPLALTVSATGVNKVYDGTTTATVTLLDNRMAGDVLSDTYTTASFADASVGNNKPVSVTGIAISGTDAGNYTLASNTATTTANITPATLVVTVTGVTASNKVYDGTMTATIDASAAVLHGVQQGDVVTLNSSAASGAFTGKNVGTGITVQVAGLTLAGANAGNYTLTQPTTTANITAATISGNFTAADRVYDGGTSATILTALVHHHAVRDRQSDAGWRDGELCQQERQPGGDAQDSDRDRLHVGWDRCWQLPVGIQHADDDGEHHGASLDGQRHGCEQGLRRDHDRDSHALGQPYGR